MIATQRCHAQTHAAVTALQQVSLPMEIVDVIVRTVTMETIVATRSLAASLVQAMAPQQELWYLVALVYATMDLVVIIAARKTRAPMHAVAMELPLEQSHRIIVDVIARRGIEVMIVVM